MNTAGTNTAGTNTAGTNTAESLLTLDATETSFHVEGYEKIDYSLLYVNGVFELENTEVADSYRPFG